MSRRAQAPQLRARNDAYDGGMTTFAEDGNLGALGASR